MSTAIKPLRALTSRLVERINNTVFSSLKAKEAVIAVVRSNPARYTQLADQAASGTTTTLQNSTYLQAKVEAGRRYRVFVTANATNGTGANGLKLGVNITGTQTSARAGGWCRSLDLTNAATTLVSAAFALTSGAKTLSDADAASYQAGFDFFLVPQNDGLLTVQFAENANGNGTAVLKQDSFMDVAEVE